ncbi:DNA polymerase zeta catalytic subunit isoform X2 [Adelges cooleyi]|uniref:DNA polymerase zeta catalytic subunit isoform X2 n=1 Tax=Adelges cooleyi TaxID=133065 RepID=UPI00217F7169|nr:DNA polymerase zeta catalytic subunit isoform X2 [Adelges cooleyi]
MENTPVIESVCLVTIDHYVCSPVDGLDSLYSEFWATQVTKVPVLRVFGSTIKGEKCCLHIHGVFPYIFVELDESLEANDKSILYNFANSLDKALCLAIGTTNSKSRHIHNILIVSGKSFYGYHSENSQYLKILFYNPYSAKVAVDLLQNGAVCNTIFQPHEAHIPFHLQFMIDFNIHGMNYIRLSNISYRANDDQCIPKTSRCIKEMDTHANYILNPGLIDGELENPGLATIREQINKLTSDLNVTRKGIEVFSGERKSTSLSNLEIKFIKDIKNKLKKIKQKKVNKSPSELEASVNEGVILNLSQTFQSQAPFWDSQSIDLMNLLMNEEIKSHNDNHELTCDTESEKEENSDDDMNYNDMSLSLVDLHERYSQNTDHVNTDSNQCEENVSKTITDEVNFSQQSNVSDRTFIVNNRDQTKYEQYMETPSQTPNNDNSSFNLNSKLNIVCDEKFTTFSTIWTSITKPPSYEDALNNMDKFQHTRGYYQNNIINNDSSAIECIRKNLLSISFTGFNDFNFFASESNVILEPLKQAPTHSMAMKWLEKRHSKNKYKKKFHQKDIFSPQSIPKSVMLNKINHSTPVTSQGQISKTTSPCTPTCSQNKRLRSKRKLSTLFLDSLKADNSNDSRSEFFNSFRTYNSSDSNILDGMQLCGSVHNFCIDTENTDHLTIFTMELHTQTRSSFNPDPEYDSIEAIFYRVFSASQENPSTTGFILVDDKNHSNDLSHFKSQIIVCHNEEEMLDRFIQIVIDWDPEILCGYEIEMQSWGYLKQRCNHLGRNLNNKLSRIILEYETNHDPNNEDSMNIDLKLKGRIVLNIWRLLRHELAVQSYTFENMVFLILNQRVPNYSYQTLSYWWNHNSSLYRWLTVDHYLFKVESTINILQQLDLIGRTSELAKLFGIQFYEVLSRGSQFRVESMMLRLAKKKNFVAVSPSIKQRAEMNAPQSLPLIMEPQSKFYTDPVVVLDFQSLYPSIIIAYNYCFSTCLGSIDFLGKSEVFKFGCTTLKVAFQTLLNVINDITISPCGVAFVKKNICKGILPTMLQEILDTRIMVKNLMKEQKNNKHLWKILNAQQLGLKLIANVTYGYTAANFSGRMPSIEVGDSVVSKGRETLERAITLIQSSDRWNAQVIYGDTDSIFVLLKGRSKEEAFKIGNEMADVVTKDNPVPVKLKFEKVYWPCILQTKKRYCGYMYENIDQKRPKYEAKGIETVRRDGCPAVSKILEKSLCTLFETKNIAAVRCYVDKQFKKIFKGNVNIQDFLFAREYRGRRGYKPGACVPALELAKQLSATDRRAEPRDKERVPYVIVAGPKGLPLIKLVQSPRNFLTDKSARINAEYYISRAIIPPLQRCFSLLNVDINQWYSELPRVYHYHFPDTTLENKRKHTLSQYFFSINCILCNKLSQNGFCDECKQNPQYLVLQLNNLLMKWSKKQTDLETICRSCCGRNVELKCNSLDCQNYYSTQQASKDMQQYSYINNIKDNLNL